MSKQDKYKRALTELGPLDDELQAVLATANDVFGKPHHGRNRAVVAARKRYASARMAFDNEVKRISETYDKTPDEVVNDFRTSRDEQKG